MIFPVLPSPLIARSAARERCRWCSMAQEQSAEVGEPAEYDSGVVFGKGEVCPGCGGGRAGCLLHLCGGLHPALWSAEQPNLYEAEIALLREGALVERTGLKVGLRKFELKDRQMLLNGKRIVFKGVNRHEWSCRTGRTVSREEMLWDVKEPEGPQRERRAHQPLPGRPVFSATLR